MTEQEARAIYHQGEEAVVAKLLEFDARLMKIEAMLSLNSTNSSKPPSTDNKLKRKVSAKTKSSKKRGGQVGHKGNHLKFSATPDVIEEHYPDTCTHCQYSLDDTPSSKVERRQLFDLPEIKMHVTEYRAHTKICPCCKGKNKAIFAEDVKSVTQYGNNLKAFISYCHSYQMLPYERIVTFIEDLSSHKIGVGTVYNVLETHYERLDTFERQVKGALLKSKVLHSDETGVHVKDKLHWIHVTSNDNLTYYFLHQRRGSIAMDAMDILPRYQGTLIHDHWKPYNRYNCAHGFCNAHLLRELTRVIELDNVQWSKDMHHCLTHMNTTVRQAKEHKGVSLTTDKVLHLTKRYKQICKGALTYYVKAPQTLPKKRGRPKQEKAKNLLDRLTLYQHETLQFLNDFDIPFTNNLAERDLRMIKVKEKISGTFASFHGGEIFCRIRGYISTLKKNGISVLEGLKNALLGNAYCPGVGV